MSRDKRPLDAETDADDAAKKQQKKDEKKRKKEAKTKDDEKEKEGASTEGDAPKEDDKRTRKRKDEQKKTEPSPGQKSAPLKVRVNESRRFAYLNYSTLTRPPPALIYRPSFASLKPSLKRRKQPSRTRARTTRSRSTSGWQSTSQRATRRCIL